MPMDIILTIFTFEDNIVTFKTYKDWIFPV
jgi:hypothetical protein